jgi:hypothetical protein
MKLYLIIINIALAQLLKHNWVASEYWNNNFLVTNAFTLRNTMKKSEINPAKAKLLIEKSLNTQKLIFRAVEKEGKLIKKELIQLIEVPFKQIRFHLLKVNKENHITILIFHYMEEDDTLSTVKFVFNFVDNLLRLNFVNKVEEVYAQRATKNFKWAYYYEFKLKVERLIQSHITYSKKELLFKNKSTTLKHLILTLNKRISSQGNTIEKKLIDFILSDYPTQDKRATYLALEEELETFPFIKIDLNNLVDRITKRLSKEATEFELNGKESSEINFIGINVVEKLKGKTNSMFLFTFHNRVKLKAFVNCLRLTKNEFTKINDKHYLLVNETVERLNYLFDDFLSSDIIRPWDNDSIVFKKLLRMYVFVKNEMDGGEKFKSWNIDNTFLQIQNYIYETNLGNKPFVLERI